MFKHKHIQRVGLLCLALLFCLLLVVQVRASPLADTIDWWVFGGGGGSASGGNITLSDTIGQPVAGSSSGSDTSLEAGFWGGVSPEYHLYLAVLRR